MASKVQSKTFSYFANSSSCLAFRYSDFGFSSFDCYPLRNRAEPVQCLPEAKKTVKHPYHLETEVFEKLPIMRVEAVLVVDTVFTFVVYGK